MVNPDVGAQKVHREQVRHEGGEMMLLQHKRGYIEVKLRGEKKGECDWCENQLSGYYVTSELGDFCHINCFHLMIYTMFNPVDKK